MYSFNNDYSEGACPEIMQAMLDSNFHQSVGYGNDEVCEQARNAIKEAIEQRDCDIHFLVGGTQANLTVIAASLRPYEAVISANTGHINVHETGAIEATGHKVILADSYDGKISIEGIHKVIQAHTDEHMVKPKMVYISNATEIGSVYTLSEIKALRAVCDQYGLYLYMDGARLPMALTSIVNDVTMADIAQLCDVFYLGGTKCGALFGEAVVIINKELQPDFRFMMKQRGGMLAKGRLLGLQFLTLFQEQRYYAFAKHANEMAQRLQDGLRKQGVSFLIDSPTNQIFAILSDTCIEKLKENYQFQVWEPYDDTHIVIRFVISWATPIEVVDMFLHDFRQCNA